MRLPPELLENMRKMTAGQPGTPLSEAIVLYCAELVRTNELVMVGLANPNFREGWDAANEAGARVLLAAFKLDLVKGVGGG